MSVSTPLSVVIITFNEEKNIAACLAALGTIADDIVVVDSFSTDKTEEICRKTPNVRFIQHTFKGHVEQKNYAITQALHPHILSLDADEVLSDILVQNILTIKKNWQYDGYYLNRLNIFCQKPIRHGSWYPDRKLRLWDSRKGQWEGDNPHDKFVLYKGGTSSRIKGDLLHYSFHSIQQHIEQINKFTDIRSKLMHQKGQKANAYHLYLKPIIKFFISYVLRLGFLDGFYGLVISKNSAHAVFLKYAKLKALQSQDA